MHQLLWRSWHLASTKSRLSITYWHPLSSQGSFGWADLELSRLSVGEGSSCKAFSTWTQAISQRKEQVGLFCHIGTAQSDVKTFLWFWQLSEKHSEEIGTVKNSAAIISVPYIYIFMYAYIFKNCIKAVTGLLLKKKKKILLRGLQFSWKHVFEYYYNRSQNKKCLIMCKLKPVFGYIEKKTKWGN